MLSEDQEKKLAQGKEKNPVEAPQASTRKNSPQQVPKSLRKPQRPTRRAIKGKGKGKAQVEQGLPAQLHSSQDREDSHGQCVQYGKNSYGIQKQGRGKIEKIFSKEVELVKLVIKTLYQSLKHLSISNKINKRILRKCGGDLEHAISSRCIEPCSTEDHINAMEDINTRTKIGRNWYKPPMDRKPSGKPITKPNAPHDKAPLKSHKCGSTSHLANTCLKKTRINEIEIEKDDTKETNDVTVHESYSEPSEEEELPDESSHDFMDLIHLQDAKMQKSKPARGKVYTAGSPCITNIVTNNREAKIHLDSGAFCTFVGKDYLDKIHTNWQDRFMQIEGIKFSSASQNMHPLGIFEAAMIFTNPAGIIRLKVEFVVMNNCTSPHFILGNDYVNAYGIDINNHEDRYFTTGEGKRQRFAFSLEKREITVIRKVKNVNKEKFVSDQLIEAQMSPELTPEMKEEFIKLSFPYREAFASDNEPLGSIKGHKVEIMHNLERPYP
ncbi:hypothetical protein O181_080773 [Austropuccinia psidii MF-1]|uniref:Uncharacterized protein n=1 Tax=Austropuccinia psidii MF-1 TaxID=1389203 RepID=A0A9Q3IGU2_9BASI|nr:hypothetical protein [Austropuccinia psidii MF-1]